MLNRLSIIVILLLTVLNINQAWAQAIYVGCISGYDYGGDEAGNIVVTPVPYICVKNCISNCKTLYSRTTTITDASGNKVAGEELNNTQLLDCQSSCQNGESYTSGFYSAKPDNTLVWNAPVTNNGYCVRRANDEVVDAGMGFTVNDTMILGVAFSTEITNKVFACGRKHTYLRPIFARNDPSRWNDTTSPQTMWTAQDGHECLYNLTASEYNNLSNTKLWDYQSPDIGANLTPAQRGVTGSCKWSARNPSFTNTQLWIKDGDELSISWKGEFIYYPNSGTTPPINNATRQTLYNCSKDAALTPEVRNWCASTMIQNSQFSILASSSSNSITGSERVPPLIGEVARNGVPIGGYPTADNLTPSTWNGLNGSVFDTGLVSNIDSSRAGCSDPATSGSNPNCIVVTTLGTPQYIYQGVLNGYNTQRDALLVRHFDANDPANWGDNYGGYDVRIDWGGCVHENGELLQYQIAHSKDDLVDGSWVDVPPAAFTAAGLVVNGTGRLFLRIRGEAAPGSLPTDVQDLYNKSGNRFGGYNISVKKMNTGAVNDGPFASLVRQIHQIILGSPGSPGTVAALFNAIAANPIYISLMRAVLAFYLVFFAIGFMIGVVPLNQNEALKRTFKISLIVTITSPGAWQFLSDNFLNIFIYGGLNLIGDVVSSGMPSMVNKIAANPYAAFDMLDQPIKDIASPIIWKKIGALAVNSAYGILVALLVIFAIAMFALSLVKAVLIYVFSVIGIGMLIIAMPVFITFMLFQRTKELFDLWWKNLILFALQPVIVFAAILLYYTVLKIILRQTLNFSICPFCILPLNIFGVLQLCLIDGWRTVFSMHAPVDAGALFFPLGIIFLAVCCLMLAHNMYMFIEMIVAFSSRMITMRADTALSTAAGSAIGMGYNTGMSALSDIGTAGATAIGGRQAAQYVGQKLGQGRQKIAGVVGIDKDAGLRSDSGNEAERMRERLMK